MDRFSKGIVIMVHFPKDYSPITYGITWHIPTFFALTGILTNKKADTSFAFRLSTYLKSILWPYFSLSILFIIFDSLRVIIVNSPFDVIDNIKSLLFTTISGAGIGTLWFLPTLFVARLVFSSLGKKKVIISLLFMVVGVWVAKFCCSTMPLPNNTISLLVLVQNIIRLIGQSMIAIGFMGIGCVIESVMTSVLKSERRIIVLISFGLVSLLINFILYPMYVGNDMHYARISAALVYLVCSVMGVIALIVISHLMSLLWSDSVFNKILCFFGRNSLIVMTTHLEYYVIAIVKGVVFHYLPVVLPVKCFAFITVCVVEACICFVVNKTVIKKLYRL